MKKEGTDKSNGYGKRQWFGLTAGIFIFVIVLFAPLGVGTPKPRKPSQ